MSANNFILIKKNHKGTAYGVQHCDADTGAEIEFLGTFDRLTDAIVAANDFMKENEVEYGLSIENDSYPLTSDKEEKSI